MTEISEMFEIETSTTLSNDQVKLETPATETPVVEAQTEEVEPEQTTTTDTTAEVKEKSFFDKFQKPEKTEETTSDTIKAEETATAQTKQDTLETPGELALKQELEKYKNHPAVKLLVGDKDLTQVDLNELFKQAAVTDFTKLSDEKLVEESLKANPAFSQLTSEEAQEEIERVIASMEGMSKLEKLTKRNEMVEALNKAQPENTLLKTLTELQDNQKKAIDPEEYYTQKAQQEFDTAFNDLNTYFTETGKSLVGQNYNGYTVTEEDYNTMVSMMNKNVKEFDKERVLFEYFHAATADKREAAAEKRGYEKGIKEAANPSRNDTGSTVIVTREATSGLKDVPKEDFFAQANQ